MQNIEGKTAFITGGASGIGLGIAKVFASYNMKIVIADLRQKALDEAMEYFKNNSREVYPIKLDVTDREAFARAADETESVFGNLHILINNAGVGSGGPLQNMTYKDWDYVMGINVGGVINGIVTFLPRMIRHGEEGHIISTSSTGGFSAVAGSGIYCASKFAVAGIMESLASDLEGTNINASVLFPGPVMTNLPLSSNEIRPDHLKNENNKHIPSDSNATPPFDMSRFMDPLEIGKRIVRAIKRNDLFIMSHPEFAEGLKARNNALLRAVPDEKPDEKRHEILKSFGTLLYNPIYDKQSTPGPPDWD